MSEVQNQPFQLTVEAPEPCRRIIKVVVPQQEWVRQYQRRLTAAVRSYERPGFRKGKTSRPIVEKELGDRLRAETFEDLLPEAYRAAVIEHDLRPVAEPVLENLVLQEGSDVGFDLVVEVHPEVTAADHVGLPITEPAVEISGEEVDEVVERLREQRAVFERVSRPAAAGDRVVVDLVPRHLDGTQDEARRVIDQRVVVGDEQNLPAFNEAVLGVEAGQRRDISVAYPEDYGNPDLRSQTIVFDMSVSAVEQKILPEIDDAFASQLQEGQTLLELRARIREGLTLEARRNAAEEMEAQALDRLLERNEVPVPPSLVESWLENSLEELKKANERTARISTDAQDQAYRAAFRPVAEREIKGMYLLEAVRRQEGIGVTDEEVEERIAAIAAEHGFDLEKYRNYLAQGDELSRIRRELLRSKTYGFLLSRAVISQPGEEAPAEPAAESAGEERG